MVLSVGGFVSWQISYSPDGCRPRLRGMGLALLEPILALVGPSYLAEGQDPSAMSCHARREYSITKAPFSLGH